MNHGARRAVPARLAAKTRVHSPVWAALSVALGDRSMVKTKHTGCRARREHLIVWRLSGESDDGAFHGADEGERDGSGRRAGWDRAHSAPGADEAGAALDETFGNPLDAAPDRVILIAELEL